MREGLRHIAELPLPDRVVFLREQADIIADRDEALEQSPGLLDPADQAETGDQPEAARQEWRFAAGEPVYVRLGAVSQHKSPDQELAFDRVDRAAQARVGRGQ